MKKILFVFTVAVLGFVMSFGLASASWECQVPSEAEAGEDIVIWASHIDSGSPFLYDWDWKGLGTGFTCDHNVCEGSFDSPGNYNISFTLDAGIPSEPAQTFSCPALNVIEADNDDNGNDNGNGDNINKLYVHSQVGGQNQGGVPIIQGQWGPEGMGGITSYDREVEGETVITLIAPDAHPEHENAFFVHWSNCSLAPSNICTIEFSGGQNKAVVAHYKVEDEPESTWDCYLESEVETQENTEITAVHSGNASPFLWSWEWHGLPGEFSCEYNVCEGHFTSSGNYNISFTVGEETFNCGSINVTEAIDDNDNDNDNGDFLSCEPSTTSITLRYNNVPSLRLFRSPEKHLADISGSGTYIDEGLDPDTNYAYALIDGLGNVQLSISCQTKSSDSNGDDDDNGIDDGNGTTTDRPFSIDFKPPTRHTTLMSLLSYLVRLLFWAGIAGMSLIVLYGAFQMIFSGGDPVKFAKGQKTIMYAVLGLILILLSWAIVAIIRSALAPN